MPGDFLSDDNPSEFTLFSDTTIVAKWNTKTKSLSVDTIGGGHISAVSSSGTPILPLTYYDCGTQVSLLATADNCYNFVH